MKKRYLILAIGFVAFIGIVLGVLAMLPPRPGVTKANFDRLGKGMAVEDVTLILGEQTGPTFVTVNDVGGLSLLSRGWFGRDGSFVEITFEGNRAIELKYTESTETTLDTIRRWLHLD